MPGRVEGKVALIVGGGQAPGATIGNGRATAELLAREGAKVAVADVRLQAAQDTVDQIKKDGGDAIALQVDVTSEESCKKLVDDTLAHYGRLDILHNNVGGGLSLATRPWTTSPRRRGTASSTSTCAAWCYTAKFALPALRESGHGSIVNISSMAAMHEYPRIGYKATKTAILALTENLAASNAKYNVRANAILPGKINTPMAIEPRVATGRSREEVVAPRECHGAARRQDGLGLGHRQGSALPALGRRVVHHRRLPAGRWGRERHGRRRVACASIAEPGGARGAPPFVVPEAGPSVTHSRIQQARRAPFSKMRREVFVT